MNRDEMLKRIKASDFIDNNGKILRGIHMLMHDYKRLSSIYKALGIDSDDFMDSVNYLIESEYIRIRHCDSHKYVELADFNLDEIESKLTAKGIQLLAGAFNDPCVSV